MARGRKRGRPGPAMDRPVAADGEACPLCGEVVPVGEDGRCDLGHRVRAPGAPFAQAGPLSHVEVLEPGVGVPAAPIAGLAAEGLALGDTLGDTLSDTERLDTPDDDPFGEDAPAEDASSADDTLTGEPRDGDPEDDEPDDGKPGVDFSSELDW